MINWKNPGWSDKSRRREQLDTGFNPSGRTRYGLTEMAVDEKKGVVSDHFSRVAAKYDFMNTLLSFGLHYAWKRGAFRLIDAQSGDHILDVCGGTGDMSVLAQAAIGENGRVVLYDINRKMMVTGRENRLKRGSPDRITYIQGDAENMSFPDNAFDAVMVSFGIRNLTHLKAGFSEMHRVLKPGGRFLCLEFSRPENPMFRGLYDIYSFTLMPLLGRLITGSARAYACLPETIRMFPLPYELSKDLREVGFSCISFRPMLNGIAVAHTAKK
ncbi:MAG: class I SAM-dependent methyltransferase [Desulfobacterales bacterium]